MCDVVLHVCIFLSLLFYAVAPIAICTILVSSSYSGRFYARVLLPRDALYSAVLRLHVVRPAPAPAGGQRGLPPWGNFGPPSANSSSAKKSSCFKMLHTIISRKSNEHCKILHYETSKSKKAFSFWAPDPLPGVLQMSPAR